MQTVDRWIRRTGRPIEFRRNRRRNSRACVSPLLPGDLGRVCWSITAARFSVIQTMHVLLESRIQCDARYTTNRVTPTNLSFGSTFSRDWTRIRWMRSGSASAHLRMPRRQPHRRSRTRSRPSLGLEVITATTSLQCQLPCSFLQMRMSALRSLDDKLAMSAGGR